MRRLLVPFVLVALAVAARAEKYTSKALGFSASYPYPVKERVEVDGGGTAAGVDPRGIMYMVGVTPENEEVGKRKTVKQQLDDGLAGALQRVQGRVASQRDVKLGKHPGREVEIDLEGGHATFRAYIVGARVYLIGVVHMGASVPPMTAADFFASFHLAR